MVHRMFSIFDVKAGAYLPPFVLPTDGMALRVFTDCVNSEKHQFGANPGDYTLFQIGSFDDSNAMVVPHAAGVKMANGLEVVKSGEYERELELVPTLKEAGDEAT